MNVKKYTVTNKSEGSVTLLGRRRLEIPGNCVDLPVEFPEDKAADIVAKLKQRYPLLVFKAVKEDVKPVAQDAKAAADPAKDNKAAAKTEEPVKK